MTPERPVLIAGGGIGGLATAIALAQRGIASRVLERRPQFSEEGAGIQLGPNAVHALRHLGVADTLAPRVGVPTAIVLRDGMAGHALQRLPLGEWIAARHAAPYWLAHRRDLQRALLDTIGELALVRVSMSFDVASYESNRDGVTLIAHDGARVAGSTLIGADGVFSRVRQQLWNARSPRFSGMTAARTVVSAKAVAGLLDTSAVGVWIAPGAHVVHYPVRGGREIAVIVIAPAAASDHGWARPVDSSRVLASVRGFSDTLLRALEVAADWRCWALYELDPLPRWSAQNVTLLGDAAHPTLPFLAQGGALALEDAVVLASSLSSGGDVAPALAAYEIARRQRTRAIVAAARRNGRIFHLLGLAARARNIGLGLLPPERVMARLDWVYGWRP